MLDDVTDVAPVATIAKPLSCDDSDKAALAYLEASGARAISVTTGSGGTVIAVGLVRDAVAVIWLPADMARAVAARARKLAGDAENVEGVVAALREAATQLRVTLTEHDTAVARAGAAAQRLDEFMDGLKESGIWLDFTRSYRQRRLAAKSRGEGFMPFAAAELRLARVDSATSDRQAGGE